jgi:heterodisulfide reductase subunit C
MPTTLENWNPGKAQDRHPEVTYEEKERLFLEVKNDLRYEEFLYGCYECGICVSACPSARFYDFSPRVIAQAMAREDVERVYDIITEDIWNCAQCFSCVRCPRQNNPGGLVTILREVSIKNGLQESKDALQGYSRVIYKVMLKGNQVSPDMLQPDFFPDWGPWVKEFSRTCTSGAKPSHGFDPRADRCRLAHRPQDPARTLYHLVRIGQHGHHQGTGRKLVRPVGPSDAGRIGRRMSTVVE